MKYIYISCYLPLQNMLHLVDCKKVNLAAQKYHKLLIEGLEENSVEFQCVSLLPINRSNCEKRVIKKQMLEGNKYIIPTLINFVGIKQIILLFSILRILFIEKKQADIRVIVDGLNVTACIATIIAKRILKIKCLSIITDMPGYFADNKNQIIQKINLGILKKFDYYVFLTKYMNDIIQSENGRYIVLEGQVDCKKITKAPLDSEVRKKVFMYTGSIHKVYGIENLVQGFLKAQLAGCELHIYGDGDYRQELLQITKNEKSIKYFGVADNNKILIEQQKAYLLINPRPIDGEFTKYSFPSKNLEYMSSGTAMITTKLPGIPKEYNPFIYFFEEDSVQGICDGLCYIARCTEAEVLEKGKKAYEFVLENKNKKVQAEKMVKLLKEENKCE